MYVCICVFARVVPYTARASLFEGKRYRREDECTRTSTTTLDSRASCGGWGRAIHINSARRYSICSRSTLLIVRLNAITAAVTLGVGSSFPSVSRRRFEAGHVFTRIWIYTPFKRWNNGDAYLSSLTSATNERYLSDRDQNVTSSVKVLMRLASYPLTRCTTYVP